MPAQSQGNLGKKLRLQAPTIKEGEAHLMSRHSRLREMVKPPSFYIYDDASFDHSLLIECVPGWAYSDQAAEVAMVQLLQRHPARVLDPRKASLFILPIFPYVSLMAGT